MRVIHRGEWVVLALLRGSLGQALDFGAGGVEDGTAGVARVDRDAELVERQALHGHPGAHDAPADGVLEDHLPATPGLPITRMSSPLTKV